MFRNEICGICTQHQSYVYQTCENVPMGTAIKWMMKCGAGLQYSLEVLPLHVLLLLSSHSTSIHVCELRGRPPKPGSVSWYCWNYLRLLLRFQTRSLARREHSPTRWCTGTEWGIRSLIMNRPCIQPL